MSSDIIPKWAKEIERFLSVKPQFILWGNIYDVYPLEMGGYTTTLPMIPYITNLLKKEGYQVILQYEPLYGFTALEGTPDLIRQVSGEAISREKPLLRTLVNGSDIIEKVISGSQAHSAIIFSTASRLQDVEQESMNNFTYRMFNLSQKVNAQDIGAKKAPKYNLLLWLLDKENDIPPWYTLDNPRIKVLSVPNPDFHVRDIMIRSLAEDIDQYHELDETKRNEIINLFIDQTSGLHASEIISIVALAHKEQKTFKDIGDAIQMYKLGITDNPWSKLRSASNKIATVESELSKRVIGQSNAVKKTVDIVKRSVYDLSGSQYSRYSQRPKGVLFLAGPTGVGKTELAKAITAHLFGSDSSYIRFDMSEYSHEHADQRLVGAPPGYVGYDVGGQLTNAIKQNPFSVVLFDEIEKAHNKILDIFLQILDDGRLTSGRGETVYFSESLIIFTSNLGLYREKPDGTRELVVDAKETSYKDLSTTVLDAIKNFFYGIKRPEILNRIGENIVVFDFIRSDVAVGIFEKMLNNVLFRVLDAHAITIEFMPEAKKKIFENCCADLSMGGRGIGNKLEDIFINPLSRAMFALQATMNDVLTVQDLTCEGTSWNLTIEKKSTSI